MQIGKIFTRSLVLLFFALLAQGCGTDTLSDTVSRQKDIEREKAIQTSNTYNDLEGEYRPASDWGDHSVEASMQKTMISNDSASVPQAVLVGKFLVRHKKDNVVTPYSFYKGQYDRNLGTFTARVFGVNKADIDVSCKVHQDEWILNCQWITNGTASGWSFSLAKK
jgi:hypothetical protein